MDRRADEMLEALRSAGMRITVQRRAIVELMAGNPMHPTAQEIFSRLQETDPGMSFSTVYNTLAVLREQGMCAELAVGTGPARFDPNVGRHHHSVCDRCGAVRDIPADDDGAPEVPGFRVRTVELLFRGVCAACDRAGDTARSPDSAERPSRQE